MAFRVMRLAPSGLPVRWIDWQEAAILAVRNQILWSLGDEPLTVRGGINRRGQQSVLEISPMIACQGHHGSSPGVPALTNPILFRRDRQRCLYCGEVHSVSLLTRDHVLPKVQGGSDCWTNVVTACRRCNQHKGGRTPEQAGMPLLAVPFRPNIFEFMYLANRNIRGDQMAYLSQRFGDHLKDPARGRISGPAPEYSAPG